MAKAEVIKSIVHFGVVAALVDCVEKPTYDGGRFIVEEGKAFVELAHVEPAVVGNTVATA